MALNSWHTPTAREGESKFNHLCYKSPTAVYYVHRWCLRSFAGWQCSACLMPGREQCFSRPGDSGKTLFFPFAGTMWISNLSHFTFHLNQPSSKKSKFYCRPHLAEAKAEKTEDAPKRTDYAAWK